MLLDFSTLVVARLLPPGFWFSLLSAWLQGSPGAPAFCLVGGGLITDLAQSLNVACSLYEPRENKVTTGYGIQRLILRFSLGPAKASVGNLESQL